MLKIPTITESLEFLKEAESLNPGPWVKHAMFAGQAAQAIASRHPGLDPDAALVLGYLHDIGRREGVHHMRHVIDGYRFLQGQGFDDAARICLTHSFPVKDVRSVASRWDCSEEEVEFVRDYLGHIEYTDYDRLLQLCDALTLPSGYVLIEKRLVEVCLRYGVNEHTVPRWNAFFEIQRSFERTIGASIYSLLPGVVETTFGFVPDDGNSAAGHLPRGGAVAE